MEGGREEGWLGREGERGWGEDDEREFKGEQQGKALLLESCMQ